MNVAHVARITPHPAMSAAPSVGDLLPSWRRALLAANRSPHTLAAYLPSVQRFADYLHDLELPRAVNAITQEHCTAYLAWHAGRGSKPNTLAGHYRALRCFFAWLVDESEITVSPMDKVKPPKVPEQPVPVLTDDQLRSLLKRCEGPGFEARRDMAIVRLLIDTGMRRSELAGLTLGEMDLESNTVVVHGKGRRDRVCAYGLKTAQALDRYLRTRAAYPHAFGIDHLWVGQRGALAGNTIYRRVKTLGREAGITGDIWLHQFRHTFAHNWLAAGGQEGDLIQLAGWRSRAMLGRYGASTAAARAREAYRNRAPGDRL